MGEFKITLIVAAAGAGMMLLAWIIGPMAWGFMAAGMFALAARGFKKPHERAMRDVFNLLALVTFVATIVVQVMKS
jgi:hypothetical protein